MKARLLAWLALGAVGIGCGTGQRDGVPPDGADHPAPAELGAGAPAIRLAELQPQTSISPLLAAREEVQPRSDLWTSRDAVGVSDDEGRPCWLYSTSDPAGPGSSAAAPVLTRDSDAVPEGAAISRPHFVFSRPRERLVVSTAAAQKGAGAEEAASWSGSSTASFLLPAGATRLVLRAAVKPPEAPPLEIELWVDGELLSMEFLEVGALIDTTVELSGGRHEFELRCPRLQTASWAPLVRPIELELAVEASRGMVLLYDGEPRPPRELRLSYGGAPAGERALADWAAGLAVAGTAPLHRRVERGCCSHDVVLAPTPTTLTYTLEVPPRARLAVGLGLDPTAGGAAAKDLVGEILVDAGDGPRPLWSGTAGEGDGCDAGLLSLSLAGYEGARVSLTLTTRSDPGDGAAAYWIEPTVFATADPAGVPGVILVSIDTLRADHLGCYGYERPTSPVLDDLAAGATLYRRAYTTYPTTMLSHMALLRGTHPDALSRSLAREAGVEPTPHLPDAVAMVQQRLRSEGWITAAFTGGGAVDRHFGFGEGFDAYCDCRDADDAGALADRAARWLETYAGAPFFLFLHTYEVHGPYAPPDGFTELAGGAAGLEAIDPYAILGHPADPCASLDDTTRQAMVDLYDGEIRYTDQALVGRLLDTLGRLDLADGTLLVVTSDHGEEFGEHGCWLHGTHLYEETVHVPLVVRYPGGQHRGEVVDGPVSLVDVAPTILAALGLEYGDMQGTPLPRTSDRARGADAVARGVRFDVQGLELITSKAFVAGRTHKLVHSRAAQAAPHLELYDLRADPAEERDHLVAGEPAVGTPAHRELLRLRAITDPTVGQPLLRLEGAAAGELPPELGRQLEALGYVR